jgi:cytochrome c peroxidase
MLCATKRAAGRYLSSHSGQTRTKASFLTAGIAATGAFAYYAANASTATCSPNYDALKKELITMIDAEEEKRGDGTSIAATLIRLAWHSSGTYSAKDKTGGSNGATQRMLPESGWGANAGLNGAREFLAPLKAKYNVTFADLWTFAGVVAIENMGGPKIAWRSGNYHYSHYSCRDHFCGIHPVDKSIFNSNC